uniref:RabBD domain-containing protein n=1 Tax=Macrostomum lignano TaxID=282301 RepID=A0A1I8IJ95_9PLAT
IDILERSSRRNGTVLKIGLGEASEKNDSEAQGLNGALAVIAESANSIDNEPTLQEFSQSASSDLINRIEQVKRYLGAAMRLRSKKNMGSAMRLRSKKNMGSATRLRSKKNMGSAMRFRGKKNMGSAMRFRGKKSMASAMRLRGKKYLGSAMRLRSKKNMGSAMRLRSKKNMGSAMRLRFKRHVGTPWRWSVPNYKRSYNLPYLADWYFDTGVAHNIDQDANNDLEDSAEQLVKRHLGAAVRFGGERRWRYSWPNWYQRQGKRYLGSAMRFRSTARRCHRRRLLKMLFVRKLWGGGGQQQQQQQPDESQAVDDRESDSAAVPKPRQPANSMPASPAASGFRRLVAGGFATASASASATPETSRRRTARDRMASTGDGDDSRDVQNDPGHASAGPSSTSFFFSPAASFLTAAFTKQPLAHPRTDEDEDAAVDDEDGGGSGSTVPTSSEDSPVTPPEPDLSHLTDEERLQIARVLARARQTELEEDERLSPGISRDKLENNSQF